MRCHLIVKPLREERGQIVWECGCGLNVFMPKQKFSKGTVVQIPDNRGDLAIECPGCYAGVEEGRSVEAVEAEQQRSQEDGRTTFDDTLGDAVDESDMGTPTDDGTLGEIEVEE